MLVGQHHRYSSSYQTRPIASFLAQFTNWAKILVSSSSRLPTFTPRKRKLFSIDTTSIRETDIRSRINRHDPSHPNFLSSYYTMIPTIPQRASLYRATCQKLRPNSYHCTLTRLGDIIHVRHFWDELEKLLYQDMSHTNYRHVAPSKRMPFNPDKLGSLFYRKRSTRKLPSCRNSQKRKRPSFGASTVVYTLTTKQHIQILPVYANCRIVPRPQVPQQTKKGMVQEDDDDVPLAALFFS